MNKELMSYYVRSFNVFVSTAIDGSPLAIWRNSDCHNDKIVFSDILVFNSLKRGWLYKFGDKWFSEPEALRVLKLRAFL